MNAPLRAGAVTLAVALTLPLAAPAGAAHAAPPVRPDSAGGPVGHRLPATPTMTGFGGAVASVDPVASQVGIDVLARGGNAADAAVATAAALGVVEPYANGIGGGGYFVYYDARRKKVSTIDGRETAPASMRETSFVRPGGTPMEFDTAVNSGLSVGVPGTPATWQAVLDRWGSRSLSAMLAPAERIARRGFVVDEAFTKATADNAARFAKFPATAAVYTPGGKPVQPGTVLRQPDLARAYSLLRRDGIRAMYGGELGKAVVSAVQAPPTAPGVTVPRGGMTLRDLRGYRARALPPVHSTYGGRDVYGMGLPGSGGIAVAEALNLLEAYEQRTGVALSDVDDVQYQHRLAEASATAFADRNRWVGDVPGVPARELTNPRFAAERACGFDPAKAQPRPIAFGSPDGRYGPCRPAGKARPGSVNDGQATTHLTVSDRWGNVASYTLTIEQFGGSGIVVPGYGFFLNNELTDFNFVPMTPGVPDPNLPGPGKRPRSSMSPTIVLEKGRPVLAAGAAGGATIITTTLQTITGVLDRGRTPAAALAAPRLSSRNTAATAEPALLDSATGAALAALGQPMTRAEVIGRGTALQFHGRPVGRHGRLLGPLTTAAAETTRGGGGSGMVVRPLH